MASLNLYPAGTTPTMDDVQAFDDGVDVDETMVTGSTNIINDVAKGYTGGRRSKSAKVSEF
jgi:hypothetical protein